MATFQKSLDIKQAFDFKKDKSTAVGFITKLSIAGTALKVDIETPKDPMNPTAAIKAVAIMSHMLWELGPSDALYMSGQVSNANKMSVNTLLFNDLTNIEVKGEYVVYDYDPVAKKYYKCMYPGAEFEGIIEKKGDDLNLAISEEPGTEVQSPMNYAFQIGVKPQPKEQTITIATGDQKNIVKKWGVTVTA